MFKISFININIQINNRYDYIYNLCKDYLISNEEDCIYTINVTDNDLLKEKEISESLNESFPDSIYEATCIHRYITNALVKHQIMLIHSCVICKDDECYAFLAKSGVGKSTHIKQWLLQYKDSYVLNGDKPMYKFIDTKLYVYGTPWKGKEGYGVNDSKPLKAFCFIERGLENSIRRANESEIITRLFNQILLPTSSSDVNIFMTMLNKIIKGIPFYILHCNISKDAAIVAYNNMRKDN